MHYSNFRDKIAVILVKIFCEPKKFLVSRIPRYTIISTSDAGGGGGGVQNWPKVDGVIYARSLTGWVGWWVAEWPGGRLDGLTELNQFELNGLLIEAEFSKNVPISN